MIADETENIVEKHIYLAELALSKFKNQDRDQIFSLALEALHAAAIKFDTTKGNFVSYATTCIFNKIRSFIQKEQALKRGGGAITVRLDGWENGESSDLHESLKDENATIPNHTSTDDKNLSVICDYLCSLSASDLRCIHHTVLRLLYSANLDKGKKTHNRIRIDLASLNKNKGKRLGRPPSDTYTRTFTATIRNYLHCSIRRTVDYLKIAKLLGYIDFVPHYNSVLIYSKDQSLIDKKLMEAMPEIIKKIKSVQAGPILKMERIP